MFGLLSLNFQNLFFKVVLILQQNGEGGRYKDFSYTPDPARASPPLLSTSLTRMVHLFPQNEPTSTHHNHLSS